MLVYGKSDIGLHRSSNQDEFRTCVTDEGISFGLVCDGMGGENGGNVASHIASETIYDNLVENLKPGLTDEDYKNIIVSAVSEGNVAVYDMSLDNKQYMGMGTTAVLVVVVGDQAFIAHVGDSRVYMIREDDMRQVTKDHSVVQTLLEQGKITPDEIENHPQKNMITRAIGISCFVDIDYIEIKNISDVTFLLCSDGLTNNCSDEEIKNVITNTAQEEICSELIELANGSGGTDNITAVVMLSEKECKA